MKKVEAIIENLITDLEDLANRLVLDYNGGEEFEQYEEDRLAVLNMVDLLKDWKDDNVLYNFLFGLEHLSYSDLNVLKRQVKVELALRAKEGSFE